MDDSKREAKLYRKTNETEITLSFSLDGTGQYNNKTGVGFLDHMLDLFAKHGGFDLAVSCNGDLQVDDHHTVEDVGIVLGQALGDALGDKTHINRYGASFVPMDESLARVVIDLSGRFYLHFDANFNRPTVGDLSTEMIQHFFYSLAEKAGMNLHITLLAGTNVHHAVEAIFKAAARALQEAVTRKPTNPQMPSTKGSL